MSEAKCAQRAFKTPQNEDVIMRTILTPFAFSDLNCYRSSVLVY